MKDINGLEKDYFLEKVNYVKNNFNNYKIKDNNLYKFSQSKDDQEFLSYVNGRGGGYVKFLATLVKEFNFEKIVELGNREGLSTLAIFDALPINSEFITIDLIKDQRYCPEEMFKDRRVKFLFGDVCDLSIFGETLAMDIDFLFSDTIHHDFQLRDEWEIYQYLLADKALVAIDDININDKRRLFDEIDYLKWDLTDICHDSGWGLFLFERKNKLTKEERVLNVYKSAMKIWKRKFDEADLIVERYKNRKIKNIIKRFLLKHSFIHKASLILRGKYK